MKTVVCVKWGDLYGPEYVNNLYSMVKRNITGPFRFVCLTDNPSHIHPNIEIKPLEDKSLRGWWTKISFFKYPLFDLEGDILFIDLDMVIVDNIDSYFEYEPNKLVMKWDYPHHGGMSSCVMRIPTGTYKHVYDNLNLTKIDHSIDNRRGNFKTRKYWGDQIWIAEQMQQYDVAMWPLEWNAKFGLDCHWDPKFQKQFSQIKKPERSGSSFFKVPEGTKIISFAGPNQRHEKELHKIGKWWHSRDINETSNNI